MKTRVKALSDWIENRLKTICGELTPDKRLAFVIIALFLLGTLNIYLMFSSVYNMGKKGIKEESIEVEHIQELDFPKPLEELNYE